MRDYVTLCYRWLFIIFLIGTQFWKYDHEKDQAFTKDSDGHRYPRPISEGFPGVPSPIDTAFYDRRDSHIYFFKGTQVSILPLTFNESLNPSTADIKWGGEGLRVYSVKEILHLLRIKN